MFSESSSRGKLCARKAIRFGRTLNLEVSQRSSPVIVFMFFVRVFATVVASWFGLAGSLTPAGAQRFITNQITNQQVDHGRVEGQIVSIQGQPDNPTGLTLGLMDQTLFLRFTPRVIIKARSAEAQVEGLLKDDWAIVTVQRLRGSLVATRVEFDVQPLPPYLELTGTFVRELPTGKRIFIKLDAGGIRPLIITRQTRFRLDDSLQDSPPVLTRGQSVQALVRRAPAGLLALEIDVKSLPQPGLR